MPDGRIYPAAITLDGTEIGDFFQAGRLRTVTTSSLADLARLLGGSSDIGSGAFYQDHGARVGRYADRLFVGAATDNPALQNRDTTPRDWLSDVMGNTSIGAWQTWGAQGAALARFGSIGWLGASRTSDARSQTAVLGYTPSSIGVCAFAVADDTNSPTTTTAYAFYGHAVRMGGVSYQPTFAAELEVENRGGAPYGISNPYHINVGGGTYCAQMGSGGGQTSGTTDASAVITVVRNPNGFQRGIVFQAAAIAGADGTIGDTGFGPVMSMGRNQGLEWWSPDGGVACILRSTVTQAALGSRMEFQDAGVVFVNSSGYGTMSIANSGGVQIYNTLQVFGSTNLPSPGGIQVTPAAGGNPNLALRPASGGTLDITAPVAAYGTATPASPNGGYLRMTVSGVNVCIPMYLPSQLGLS